MDNITENTIDGIQLLRSISNKGKDLECAKKSFALFVSHFERLLKPYAEIQARNLGFSENVAFEAIQCAFTKVWKYPASFDMKKSNCKNEENAIVVWLKTIVASQMFDYVRKGVCTQQSNEEDLSIIESAKDFVDYHINDCPIEKKINLIQSMDKKISVLDEKHKIIYLTYKAYSTRGKKLPRCVLERLRRRLNITQTTIRVYRREAYIAVGDKLEN